MKKLSSFEDQLFDDAWPYLEGYLSDDSPDNERAKVVRWLENILRGIPPAQNYIMKNEKIPLWF